MSNARFTRTAQSITIRPEFFSRRWATEPVTAEAAIEAIEEVIGTDRITEDEGEAMADFFHCHGKVPMAEWMTRFVIWTFSPEATIPNPE